MAAGGPHCLALKSDGTVWAWGSNEFGQVGDSTVKEYSTKPVLVKGLKNVIDIAVGLTHSLVIKSNGTVWAWGANLFGQLGDGTPINVRVTKYYKPARAKSLTDIVSATACFETSAAVGLDGAIHTWGRNGLGQFGAGVSIYHSASPLTVMFDGRQQDNGISIVSIAKKIK